MYPQYKTLLWLEGRTHTLTLMTWTVQEVLERQRQVDAIVSENIRAYQLAKNQNDNQRRAFREVHPRASMPSMLKKTTPAPPPLDERWKKLLDRRRLALKREEERKQQKKTDFLDQMAYGRFKAMQKRESAISAILNQCAADHGVKLTERAIDDRLRELLQGIK
jgi:hypothetical protein